MKLNLPNKLTVLRLLLVPVVMVFILYPSFTGNNPVIQSLVCVALFIVTAITDFIDGQIARKYNLITDFGKFMDPVADKFMVIGSLVSITVANEILRPYMIWVSIIVIFRELGITSIRLVVANSGVVVPANWLGKCKTMAQSISIVVFLVENLIWDRWILSYVGMTVTAILTLWSGVQYFAAYWKYIDPEK